MSRRPQPDYCAPCLTRWNAIADVEERKASRVPHALTTVHGVRMCPDCADAAIDSVLEKAEMEARS